MNFFTRYRKQIYIFEIIVFGALAALNGWQYFIDGDKQGRNLFGFIIFTILFLIKIFEVIGISRKVKGSI